MGRVEGQWGGGVEEGVEIPHPSSFLHPHLGDAAEVDVHMCKLSPVFIPILQVNTLRIMWASALSLTRLACSIKDLTEDTRATKSDQFINTYKCLHATTRGPDARLSHHDEQQFS
jgi:hypothetical protein